MAELVVDMVSFFSSMGSRRHEMLLLLPAWKPTLSQAVCGGRCKSIWPWVLPRSGMTSLQGRAKGMMECWYTRAERQPGEREEMFSTQLGTWVSLLL